MSVRWSAVVAVVMALVAVVLWWLARDTVMVEAPRVDPPVDGLVSRTTTDPWLLLAGTVAAGLALVFATRALLGSGGRGNA